MARKRTDDATRQLVAERINTALKNRGITAKGLSKRTGISEADISNYRHGRYVPRQDKVFLLAMALGVSPSWLWGVSDIERTDEETELEYLWSQLTQRSKEICLDFMRYCIVREVKGEEAE